MNKQIEKYIELKEQEAINAAEAKKDAVASKLVEAGIYDKVYAKLNIIGYGKNLENDKILKFPVKRKDTKIGDKICVVNNGEKRTVTITKLEYMEEPEGLWEYPYAEVQKGVLRHYKKVPVKLTDEEYQAIAKYVKSKKEITEQNQSSFASTSLRVIGVTTLIIGILSGLIIMADEEVFTGFIVLVSSFISEVMLIGFAEIIELLMAIRDK